MSTNAAPAPVTAVTPKPSIVAGGKIADLIPVKLVVFWRPQRLSGQQAVESLEADGPTAPRRRHTMALITRLQLLEVTCHSHDGKQEPKVCHVPMGNVQFFEVV